MSEYTISDNHLVTCTYWSKSTWVRPAPRTIGEAIDQSIDDMIREENEAGFPMPDYSTPPIPHPAEGGIES